MKIAFFIRCMSNGGAEKVAAQLTHVWSDLGHEIVVFTELPPELKEYIFKYSAREWVDSEALKSESTLRKLYERYRFEVVIFNDAINSDWFEKALLTIKSFGVKTVVINHHTANNWMYGTGNTRELFMDDLLPRADALVCVDRIWALWWRHRGCNAVFIPNPVAIKTQKTFKHGAIELVKSVDEAVAHLAGAKEIVWIGRLGDKLKRAELALEIFAKVLRSNPTARMTMLGAKTLEEEKHLRRYFFRQLSTLSLRSSECHLEFPGFVSDVDAYLSMADVHLFTSVTEVTVPQVVLEARSLGVRTLAFDLPFLRRVFETVDSEAIVEKWRTVFRGGMLPHDYGSVADYQNLMDELVLSQQYFVQNHLPELLASRRLRLRLTPSYLYGRLVRKIANWFGS